MSLEAMAQAPSQFDEIKRLRLAPPLHGEEDSDPIDDVAFEALTKPKKKPLDPIVKLG